jgi:hypothetical protein
VTIAAGERDACFIAPPGSLGYLSYVDQDSKMGNKAAEHEWSVAFLPELGHDVGLLYNADCGDMNSLHGGTSTASMYESFQWSFDYSFLTAYDSGSGQGTSIFKAAFSLT